jgi:uncharacterized protein
MKFKQQELALITGASSGIGAEFARQLAADKVDLVLTARRQDRLEALASELTGKHGVRAIAIESDLNTPSGPRKLVERLVAEQLWPTILINNAGLGYYGQFLTQSPADIDAMIHVDVRALTMLCRRIGGQMAKRGRGAILNVASFAALAPLPRYSVYSGAKAYVVAFSQALRHELKPHGVQVGVICPGFTPTEFFEVSRHDMTMLMRVTQLTVPQVVAAGIRGIKRGKFLIVPGWWYKLNTWTASLVPRTMLSAMSGALVKER